MDLAVNHGAPRLRVVKRLRSARVRAGASATLDA
jgi:hypothetical protein